MQCIFLPTDTHRCAFADAAAVFAALPIDGVLCFGVQDWTMEKIEVQCDASGVGKCIAYQAELLYKEGAPFRTQVYADKLKLFDEVWEYSEHNIAWLKENGIANVKYVPIRPSPILRRLTVEKDIDILHVGFRSLHRAGILNYLLKHGYQVFDVAGRYGRIVEGEEMHNLYLRSRVLLGLHTYPGNPIQESFRYQFPLSNGITVLAEKSLSNPLGLEEFDNTVRLLNLMNHYIAPQVYDDNFVTDNYLFPQVDCYFEEGRYDCLRNDDMLGIVRAVGYMRDDAVAIAALRRAGKRSLDVGQVSVRLFNSMMLLLQYLMRRSDLGKWKPGVLVGQMHTVYRSLDWRAVRIGLRHTGGTLWPMLRVAMQTHGWALMMFCARLFRLCGREAKYVRLIPTSK